MRLCIGCIYYNLYIEKEGMIQNKSLELNGLVDK